MTSFGETLRQAREAKGLTPAELAQRTHLMAQQIEALENEDFSKIAAPIYGRGFVRLYCEAVELDPKPMIDEFMAIYSGERTPAIRMRGEQPRQQPVVAPPQSEPAPVVAAVPPPAPEPPPAAIPPVVQPPAPEPAPVIAPPAAPVPPPVTVPPVAQPASPEPTVAARPVVPEPPPIEGLAPRSQPPAENPFFERPTPQAQPPVEQPRIVERATPQVQPPAQQPPANSAPDFFLESEVIPTRPKAAAPVEEPPAPSRPMPAHGLLFPEEEVLPPTSQTHGPSRYAAPMPIDDDDGSFRFSLPQIPRSVWRIIILAVAALAILWLIYLALTSIYEAVSGEPETALQEETAAPEVAPPPVKAEAPRSEKAIPPLYID